MRKLLWFIAFAAAACSLQAQHSVEPPETGEEVYQLWCSPCHAPGPRKHPGTAALEFVYKGEKPSVLEERRDLTPEIVSFYVRNGVSIMPFFRKTEISDEQLRALGEYLSKR